MLHTIALATLQAPQQAPQVGSSFLFVLIPMALFLVILILISLFVGLIFRHWLRAFMAGTPIAMFTLVGMVFRRSQISSIVDAGIAANQAGHPIRWAELERASIAGCDLEKLRVAYCVSRDRGKHFSVDELMKAEQADTLKKLLDS